MTFQFSQSQFMHLHKWTALYYVYVSGYVWANFFYIKLQQKYDSFVFVTLGVSVYT